MDIFIKNIVDILKAEVPLSEEEIEGFIEIPPDLEKGDYAFPCFAIAKQLRNAPAKISAEHMNTTSHFDSPLFLAPAEHVLNFT